MLRVSHELKLHLQNFFLPPRNDTNPRREHPGCARSRRLARGQTRYCAR